MQESFPPLRQDLLRLAHGLYLADLVDHSVEDHAPHPDLFDLLLTGLHLSRRSRPPELAARWFEIQLLRDLGYAPNLADCAVCQTPVPGDFARDETFALSASLGGALCPRHARPASNDDHSALSFGALRLLQALDAIATADAAEALPPCPPPGRKAWTWRAWPCAAPCASAWNAT